MLLTLLMSALPNIVLSAWKTYLGSKDATTNARLQERLKQLDAVMAARADQAGLIKTAMSHKAFWIVWMTFAMPEAIWWALGTVDTILNGGFIIHVGQFPPSMKPYADLIFTNVFYSGAGTASVQTMARAAVTYAAVRRKT